jgi:2-polyprenyl-3-methyl-5-hydroxy-6-metoxy-1,4-benzoquinol methylase
MRPDDLVEFSRQCYYSKKIALDYWSSDEIVAGGLNSLETALLEKVPIKNGQLLLLGVGGGREAIPLARLGFEVTGLDFVPEMVEQAKQNAARNGVHLEGLVQEISQLDLPPDSYDIVWLSNRMYSCVPTRDRRIAMLQRIHKTLRPGGYFICSFHWAKRAVFPLRVELARKIFALLTSGNLWYEPGDILWHNAEFLHAFSSETDLRSEFEEGGFVAIDFLIPESEIEAMASLFPLSEF